jgi:hypothetical protein
LGSYQPRKSPTDSGEEAVFNGFDRIRGLDAIQLAVAWAATHSNHKQKHKLADLTGQARCLSGMHGNFLSLLTTTIRYRELSDGI